ncbi:hypothetical protein D3C77_522350 [compost metagenome]
MVGMAVTVDHRHYRLARPILVIEFEAGPGSFGRVERIDDDQPVIALNNGHVCQIDAANLVNLVCDLEQTGIGVELRHTPQAGVDGVRRVALSKEIVLMGVPHRLAIGVLDLTRKSCHQPAACSFVVGPVLERQCFQHRLISSGCCRAGGFRQALGSDLCSP